MNRRRAGGAKWTFDGVGRRMAMDERFLMALTSSQFDAVLDYRDSARLNSTSQAVRNLIAIGLKHAPAERRRITELWPVIAGELD